MPGNYSVDQVQINHEWELVAQAQAGDAGAFGHLYRLYRPVIMRALQTRLGTRQDAAQDLCADTFLAGWRAVQSLKPRPASSPVAWFMRIALNKLIDFFNSGYERTQSVVPGDSPLFWGEELRGYMTPARVADVLTRRAVLAGAMGALNPRYQEALRRRYMEQQSFAEIRQGMGMTSEGAAKQMVMRALRVARTRLDVRHRDLLLTA